MRRKGSPENLEIYSKFNDLYLSSGLSHSQISDISGIPLNTISLWSSRGRSIPIYAYEYLKAVINNYNNRNLCNADVITAMNNNELIAFFDKLSTSAFNADGNINNIKPESFRDLKSYLKSTNLVTAETVRRFDNTISIVDNPIEKDITTSEQIRVMVKKTELTYDEFSEITMIPRPSIINWVARGSNPPPYVVAYIRYKLKEYYNNNETNGDVIRKMTFNSLLELVEDVFTEYFEADGDEMNIHKYSNIDEFINGTSLINIALYDFRRKTILGKDF